MNNINYFYKLFYKSNKATYWLCNDKKYIYYLLVVLIMKTEILCQH